MATATPKQYCMLVAVPEQARFLARHGLSVGMLTEQVIEALHVVNNNNKKRFRQKKDEGSKLTAMLNALHEHSQGER